MTTAVHQQFRVGDEVRGKYMSDQTIVGVVTEVGRGGVDVMVAYEWETIDHFAGALQLLRTAEAAFIPDEKFAREVRRSRAASPDTQCTATSTVRISGGVSDRDRMGATVTVWRWESTGERPDQRAVAALARPVVAGSRGPRREKLSRLYVEVFRSEHGAGVASRTTYQVVEA